MNMINNIILNIYSISILGYVLIHSIRALGWRTLSSRLYNSMVMVALVVQVGDALSWFDGHTFPLAMWMVPFGNFLVFLFNTSVPMLYILYVHDQIWQDEKRTLRLLPLMFGFFLCNLALLIGTLANGWYYTIDAANVYHRGPLFLVSISQLIVFILIPTGMVLRNRKRLERNTLVALAMFPVPPAIALLLQVFFYGVSLMPHGLAFSMLIIFLRIQNSHLHTDHLTGVYNRKKFESVLKARIHESSAMRNFSVILLDLDNFKEINDTCGHDVGDNALAQATKLLRSCLRSNDLIARIGGDEFAVILDHHAGKRLQHLPQVSQSEWTTAQEGLASTVHRIREAIVRMNADDTLPYHLDFSMGYEVYDTTARPSAEAFLHNVDQQMYRDKTNKHLRGTT